MSKEQNTKELFSLLNADGQDNTAAIINLLQAKEIDLAQRESDDVFHNTPLIAAVNRRNQAVVSKMLKHPAAKEAINMPDLFKTQGENTPLTLALKTQQWDMAQALLDAGADPKIACAFGGTPLHLACILYGGGDENNSKIAKIITILVNKGANPAQQDSEGLSACDYFKKRWDEDDCKSVTYCKIQYDKDGAVVRNDENDPVVLEEISMPLKEFYRKYPDAKKDEGYGFCFYNTQDGKEFSCSTQNMPLDCQNLGSWFWDHGVDRRSFTTHRTEFLESAVGKLEVQKLSALLEPGKVKAIQPNF